MPELRDHYCCHQCPIGERDAPYLRIASVKHDFDNIESIDLFIQLSEIERDIIFSLLKGYKINEIAKMKGLSDKTIRKYRDIAVKKLKLYL